MYDSIVVSQSRVPYKNTIECKMIWYWEWKRPTISGEAQLHLGSVQLMLLLLIKKGEGDCKTFKQWVEGLGFRGLEVRDLSSSFDSFRVWSLLRTRRGAANTPPPGDPECQDCWDNRLDLDYNK